MASAAQGIQGIQSAALKPKFIAQGIIVIVALLIAYFVVGRVVDAGRRALSRPTVASDAVLAHCAQFVVLAKSRYGDDWKFRLDPRDTICAAQVQHEWELQSARRTAPVEPEVQSTYTERATDFPPPADEGPSISEARARNPETYCLNVMSLARTKYGAAWWTQVSSAEAAGCEAQIARAAGQ